MTTLQKKNPPFPNIWTIIYKYLQWKNKEGKNEVNDSQVSLFLYIWFWTPIISLNSILINTSLPQYWGFNFIFLDLTCNRYTPALLPQFSSVQVTVEFPYQICFSLTLKTTKKLNISLCVLIQSFSHSQTHHNTENQHNEMSYSFLTRMLGRGPNLLALTKTLFKKNKYI